MVHVNELAHVDWYQLWFNDWMPGMSYNRVNIKIDRDLLNTDRLTPSVVFELIFQ